MIIRSALSQRLAALLTAPAESLPSSAVEGTAAASVQLSVIGFSNGPHSCRTASPPGFTADCQVLLDAAVLQRLCIHSGAWVLVSPCSINGSSKEASTRACIAQAIALPSAPEHHSPAAAGISGGQAQQQQQLPSHGALVSPLLAFNLGLTTWLDPFLAASSGQLEAPLRMSGQTHHQAAPTCTVTITPFQQEASAADTAWAQSQSQALASHDSGMVAGGTAQPPARTVELAVIACPQPRLLKPLRNGGTGQQPGSSSSTGTVAAGAAQGDDVGAQLQEIDQVPGGSGAAGGGEAAVQRLVAALERYFKSGPRCALATKPDRQRPPQTLQH